MAKEYILKRNPFDRNKVLKLLKTLKEEVKQDRASAIELFTYFKNRLEGNIGLEEENVRGMLEAQKLSQNTKNIAIKLAELAIKTKDQLNPEDTKKVESLFSDLNKD